MLHPLVVAAQTECSCDCTRRSSRSASPRRRSGAAAVPEPAPVVRRAVNVSAALGGANAYNCCVPPMRNAQKEFISEFAMPASASARAHDSDGDEALLFRCVLASTCTFAPRSSLTPPHHRPPSDAPDTRPSAAAAAQARRRGCLCRAILFSKLCCWPAADAHRRAGPRLRPPPRLRARKRRQSA